MKGEPGLCVYAVARTGGDAELLAKQQPASVVLMDYRLPDMRGAEAAGMIRTASPEMAIVFESADESETDLLDAIDAGASAHLTRSPDAQIVEAVRRAAQGEVLIPVARFAKAIVRQRRVIAEADELQSKLSAFTPREMEVLRLLARDSTR